MRKIIFLIHMSLDGFVAGPNGEMDWILYDEQLAQYSYDLHEVTDTAIYGRVTYEMMAGYWPTVLSDPDSDVGDHQHARWLETATKVAVSTTLETVDWDNTILIKSNVVEEIKKMKQQVGKDMWLLGSPTLAQSFMRDGLIDEYRININPVILGSGKALFDNQQDLIKLQLVANKTFDSGVVALQYRPIIE